MVLKILIVVTSHSTLGTTGRPTGYYLPEVAHPYAELVAKGFTVDVASPQGGKAPVDPNSVQLEDPVVKRLWEEVTFREKLEKTRAISDVKPGEYRAILFAGGHGTMWDFRENQVMNNLTKSIYETGGVVAAVCHGPAALVDVKLSDGSYLVAGKKVTAFSNNEEEAAGLTQVMPFLLESELIAKGAKFSQATLWQNHVVVDGRLVTGQNPASAANVGQVVAGILASER